MSSRNSRISPFNKFNDSGEAIHGFYSFALAYKLKIHLDIESTELEAFVL